MGNMLPPIFGNDVADYLLASVILEVHVDVRHLLAFQIQETLEDQSERERVDVGHAEAVQDQTCRGAAPDGEKDVVLADEAGYVPDHQEVVIEVGLPDDFKLIPQTVLLAVTGVRDSLAQALPAYVGQVLERCDTLWDLVLRQSELAEVYVQVALVGDYLGVGYRFRQILEELFHLFWTLQIVRSLLHTKALAILDIGVGVNADQDVLETRVLLEDVV